MPPGRPGAHQIVCASIVCACVLALALSAGAEAGAWTKRKHEGLFIAGLGVHWLNPTDQNINNRRLKAEASLYVEFGLTDRITLVGRGAYQQLHEMVIPLKKKPPPPRAGFGGMEVGARVNLLQRGRWAASAQVSAGIPGSGENWINEDFGARGGGVDVRAQLGRSVGDAAFLEAAVAVRLRGEDTSEEVRLDLTAGCDFIFGTRVMLQSYSVWAMGVSGERPAYASHRIQASILIPAGRANTAQFSLLSTMHQQSMSEETAFIAALWRSF
jgi:hypothetical protein